MSTSDIQAAINSIPAKMENLRKAFEALQSYSSAVDKFALVWKDIEDHFSSIGKSIEERFRELEGKREPLALENPASAPQTAGKVVEEKENPEVEPRPELKSLCVKMDGIGLRSYLADIQKDLPDILPEIVSALRFAQDPVMLVFNSLDGFLSSKGVKEQRRICVVILECLHLLAPEIKPIARDKAMVVALEWKKTIADGKGNNNIVMGFLLLVVTFGLVSSFAVDDILDLLVMVARRKQTVDLCRSAGLQEKMPDLVSGIVMFMHEHDFGVDGDIHAFYLPDFVEKLINQGKHAQAVKFVLGFNLVDKYSPAFLLQSYLKESRKAAQAVRQKGNNSNQAKNEANAKEIAALKEVIKTVEECKLGSVYSCENHLKRIEQLEKEKAGRKRAANGSSIATPNSNVKGKKQQLQQPNKRPRPSTSVAPVAAMSPLSHDLPHFGLHDRTPYMGPAGSYGLVPVPSLYDHSSSSLSANHVRLGGTRAPPQSYLYSLPSQTASAASAYGDRALTYGSYSMSGLPSYNPSLYP
ncbi:Protein FRIGIDA [Apostasia shenzhenica]|uniref:FRIGIDA-like protein n=1 Tax=Apostasia shenzhenica TaxID=1088818 RepID=A0A2I0A2R4_9ASPA|nr:Protein FRIGIDA [Apostasia shenzhenica]